MRIFQVSSNPAAAADAPVASVCNVLCHWRRAADQRCYALMRTTTLLALLFTVQLAIGADRLKAILDTGIVTREKLNTLSGDDVPDKWRTKVEDESTEKYTMKVFFRGNKKILEVLWLKAWTGARSNMLTATVYDGQKRVGKVVRFSDKTTSISQPEDSRAAYQMSTSIKDDGKVSVSFASDSGYFQVVEVEGRDTHLIDDLEYTKQAVMLEHAMQVVEAIEDEIGEKPTRK